MKMKKLKTYVLGILGKYFLYIYKYVAQKYIMCGANVSKMWLVVFKLKFSLLKPVNHFFDSSFTITIILFNCFFL